MLKNSDSRMVNGRLRPWEGIKRPRCPHMDYGFNGSMGGLSLTNAKFGKNVFNPGDRVRGATRTFVVGVRAHVNTDCNAWALSICRANDATWVIVDVEVDSIVGIRSYTLYSRSSDGFKLVAKIVTSVARGIEMAGISCMRADQFHFLRRHARWPTGGRGDRPNMHEYFTGNDFIDC